MTPEIDASKQKIHKLQLTRSLCETGQLVSLTRLEAAPLGFKEEVLPITVVDDHTPGKAIISTYSDANLTARAFKVLGDYFVEDREWVRTNRCQHTTPVVSTHPAHAVPTPIVTQRVVYIYYQEQE